MKTNFLFIACCAGGIALTMQSCEPEIFEASGPPLPPTAINTDSIIDQNSYSIAAQTWVIERYRIGQVGEINLTSDTLFFLDTGEMLFNEVTADYAFYPSASVYVLTMYETPWGMLSGSVNTYNLEVGEILGMPFSNIAPGGNGLQVYLWMRRI